MFDDRRRGTTLVELMAALALSGIVLLGAHGLLSALTVTRAALAQRASVLEEIGVGFRHLREALMMSEAVESGAAPFFGDATGAAFSSRCRSGGGWYERCRVELQLTPYGAFTRLQMRERSGGWTEVLRREGSAHMLYRAMESDTAVWRDRWGTSIARPNAIGLAVGMDTIVLAGTLP